VVEMAFFGLRRWPVPVHTYIAPLVFFLIFFSFLVVGFFWQIARPLWPFGVASVIALWGVMKIQNMAVACT